APVAVLSDRYWRTRFGGDPRIVGAGVTINQAPFTVIGIAPREFSGTTLDASPDLWMPLHSIELFKADPKRWTASFTSWLQIAGRLSPGVSREQAQAELDILHHRQLVEQLAVSELRGRENTERFVRESHLLLRPAANGTHSGMRERYAFPL